MSTFKFADSSIIRLEETISRLNSILEAKILEVYTSKKFLRLSDEKIVDYVYSNKDVVNNLSKVRNAREYFRQAKKRSEWSSIDAYMNAAHWVYLAISDLTVDDAYKAKCKISVTPALKTALKKAENSPLFTREARKILAFIFTTPTSGWCEADLFHKIGSKKFGLVRSEKKFEAFLESGYEDITSVDLCGIRIAYKYETEFHTKSEKEEVIKLLSEALSYTEDSLLKCVDIMYPDSLYHGTYKIFIPDVQ